MDERRPPELSPESLATLRVLVERMEQHTGPWGIEHGGEQTGARSFTMPWVEAVPVALEAMRFLYDHDLIIRFEWSKWDGGREIFRGTEEDRFASLDRQTVLKLLTAVARNDRFNEGAWVAIFEDGSAQSLFKRLLESETAAGT